MTVALIDAEYEVSPVSETNHRPTMPWSQMTNDDAWSSLESQDGDPIWIVVWSVWFGFCRIDISLEHSFLMNA